MNFIEKALSEKLTGDDFLQAMADIYKEPDVRDILSRYPGFISDVIMIIDYDTAVASDGLDDIIRDVNDAEKCLNMINALERCGLNNEAQVIREAKSLADKDEDEYWDSYDDFDGRLAINNDYDAFWDKVRAYIDSNLRTIHQ